MLYNAKEAKIEIGNTDMSYLVFGKGNIPLIMIPGLNTRGVKGMAIPLAFMYRIFAKQYRVYIFDRKECIPEGYTVRKIAEDIALAMDALKLTKADVFGVSQGGMVAQYLAIDRPDLVRKLVLGVTLSKNNPTVEAVIADWIRMTEQGDMKALVLDMALKMYSDAYVKRYKPFLPILTMVQKPKDRQRFITLAKACLTCDAYSELEKIKCPVFVIGGAKDNIVTGEASKEIARKLGCECYLYESLGHAAYEEAEDFNKRVYEFLNSSEKRKL